MDGHSLGNQDAFDNYLKSCYNDWNKKKKESVFNLYGIKMPVLVDCEQKMIRQFNR